MLRRVFIQGFFSLCFLLPALPGRLFAQWNKQAFSATKLDQAMMAFFSAREIVYSDAIKIGVRPKLENGAVVPIKIHAALPEVTGITLLVEKNPNPLIAHFNLGKPCQAFIATRIKVSQPSMIVAVVESASQLYRTDTFVEVVEGGCT